MLIGVIADDFTGASDIANTLARGIGEEGGLRTVLFCEVPKTAISSEVEAGVIALKSRTSPVAEAVAESLNALAWFRSQGCRQIIYKYCSTFDSKPIGNIGPVGEAIAEALDVHAAVVCPSLPIAGRTVYQGHLFVWDRLLSESGMEHHPLTPMSDPDIRRWLAQQCRGPVGHVPLETVKRGSADLREALIAMSAEKRARLCVVDAVSENDLLTLGEALVDAPLVTGGSGIALGLPQNFVKKGLASGHTPIAKIFSGPGAILAGSCSGATRGQVEEHARKHPAMPIDVASVMEGRIDETTLVNFLTSHGADEPLVYSSADSQTVRNTQSSFGAEAVAHRLDRLFGETARALVRDGWQRIVVAGGETSGAVAKAATNELKTTAMQIGPEIDPGVPILTIEGTSSAAIALKSGNFGSRDFFTKALARMEGL